MTFVRRFSFIALLALAALGLGAQVTQAACSVETEGGRAPTIVSMSNSLSADQNTLTINYTINAGGGCDGGLNQIVYDVSARSQVTGGGSDLDTFSGTGLGLGLTGSHSIGVSALANGTYTVTLTVTNSFGSVNQSQTFTITNRATPTYTLTVTKAGTGTGTVTSSPAGISCGGDCSQSYDEGTSVTLTATPGTGSTFAGWSGAADCSDGVAYMGQSKTCTATFNTSGGAPTCSPASQIVAPGQTASFSASGGTGAYTWSGGGTPGTGSGSSFNTSYPSTGTKTVTVTSGGLTDTCSVTVEVPTDPDECNQISVSSNVATTWQIGGPQVDQQYLESPNYPTHVTNGNYTADSSGNPLPSGLYTINVDQTPDGWSLVSIAPSAAQTCNGSISYVLTYEDEEEPPPPPPGGACTGPTALGIGVDGTFSGGDGASHSWSASSPANPSSGSGASFTTRWGTGGQKTVYMDGVGGGNDCQVCVGGPGFCSPPIDPTIQLDCAPNSQTVTTGDLVNFNATYGSGPQSGNPVTVSWSASGGTPSSASGVSSFSTTYSTTGSKLVQISKSGFITYTGDSCAVTVNPPTVTTGTIEVTSNLPTVWTITSGSSGQIVNSSPDTSESYTNQPADSYTLSAATLSPPPAGYQSPTVTPSSQSLGAGGTIEFVINYEPISGGSGDVDLRVDGSDGPALILSGSAATLTWTSADIVSGTCVASGDWSGSQADENTTGVSTGALTATSSFSITCDQQGGGQASDSVEVNVRLPQCSDGIDNADTEDTDADAADDGCWTDPGDSNTYDPSDDNEAYNPQLPGEPTQCTDDLDNDGDGLYDWDGAPGGGNAGDFPPDDGCAGPEDDDERYDPDVREI